MKLAKATLVLLLSASLTIVAVMFLSATRTSAQKADAEKYESSRDYERWLIKVLRDERLRQYDREKVFEAIRKLGELRSVAAIKDLARLLALKRTFPADSSPDSIEDHPITLLGRYPAGGSLFQIGKASLPALVAVIKTHRCNNVESDVATEAIIQIFRDDYQQASSFLRQAALNNKSADAARCFKKGAEKADKLAGIQRRDNP